MSKTVSSFPTQADKVQDKGKKNILNDRISPAETSNKTDNGMNRKKGAAISAAETLCGLSNGVIRSGSFCHFAVLQRARPAFGVTG